MLEVSHNEKKKKKKKTKRHTERRDERSLYANFSHIMLGFLFKVNNTKKETDIFIYPNLFLYVAKKKKQRDSTRR